jgi:hypothetical protein
MNKSDGSQPDKKYPERITFDDWWNKQDYELPFFYACREAWQTALAEGKRRERVNEDPLRDYLAPQSAEQGSFAPYAVPECMSPNGRFSMVNGMEIDTPATRLALELGRDIYKHASEAGIAPLSFAQKITEAVNEALRLRSARSDAIAVPREQLAKWESWARVRGNEVSPEADRPSFVSDGLADEMKAA